jgi:hypothetical protein
MSTQTTDGGTSHVTASLPPTIAVPDDVLRTAERLGIAEQLPQVIALSREIFGDSLTLCVVEDPELDDWTHIVVDAQSTGTVEELVDKEQVWVRQIVRHNLSHWFTLMTHAE